MPARTLLLITASSPEVQRARRYRVLNFQQATMPYLAAFVPSHWTVLHVDEAVEPVNLHAPADLVAITFHTPSAPHAYSLAGHFRQRGITVALGGPHVTLVPDEAQAHADVIFIGEAEVHWPLFLADFETGLALESALTNITTASADKSEGIKAFMEKRSPVFKGM